MPNRITVAPGPARRIAWASVDGLPAYEGYIKELTIRCPRASRPRDFDAAIRLCAGRRLDLAPLVTGRFPLARVTEALAASEHPEHLKIVLNVAGQGA